MVLFVAVMVCNTPSSNCLLSTLLTSPISLSHLHLCLCPHCEQEGLLSQLCWLILVVMVGNDNNLISNPHSILAHNSHLTVLPVATHIVSMRGFSHSSAGSFVVMMVGQTINSTVVPLTSAFLTNFVMSHSGLQLHLASRRGFSQLHRLIVVGGVSLSFVAHCGCQFFVTLSPTPVSAMQSHM